MFLALAVVLGPDSGFPQSEAQDRTARVAALCAEGQLVEALEAARLDPAPNRAAKLEADVWWTAGDLGRALGAARAGLEVAPDDLALGSLATDLALALDLSNEAEHHVARLGLALASQPAEAPNLEWWHTRHAQLRAACEAAGLELSLRTRASVRARP